MPKAHLARYGFCVEVENDYHDFLPEDRVDEDRYIFAAKVSLGGVLLYSDTHIQAEGWVDAEQQAVRTVAERLQQVLGLPR